MKPLIEKIVNRMLSKSAYNYLQEFKNCYLGGYRNVSYSQEGEDLILQRIFERQTKGFYIDIGAHHPFRFSNTYVFYKRGWIGLNIDAMPGSMKPFDKFRAKDINIEAAVSDIEKTLVFYMFNDPALNGFSRQTSVLRNKIEYKVIKTTEIKTKRLENILDYYIDRDQIIDFMSIDVEGLDLNVLKSNKIVLVEMLDSDIDDLSNNEIPKFMLINDYTIFAKTLNTVFFRDRRCVF